MSQKIALVVDDTPANLDFLERLLTQAGFHVLAAHNGKRALELVHNLDEVRLAVVDMQIPDINGLQLTELLREQFPEMCIIVATMYDERSLMESVFLKGGNVFLVKPHGFMELYKRLTTMGHDEIRRGSLLVIDQYGPRPFTLATR